MAVVVVMFNRCISEETQKLPQPPSFVSEATKGLFQSLGSRACLAQQSPFRSVVRRPRRASLVVRRSRKPASVVLEFCRFAVRMAAGKLCKLAARSRRGSHNHRVSRPPARPNSCRDGFVVVVVVVVVVLCSLLPALGQMLPLNREDNLCDPYRDVCCGQAFLFRA